MKGFGKEKIYNEDELGRICRAYLKTFGIPNWRVIVQLVPQSEIPEKEAQCSYWDDSDDAIIKIVDPETRDTDLIYKQDMHEVLVHEILHIVFAGVDKKLKMGTNPYRQFELGINRVARTFCEIFPNPFPDEVLCSSCCDFVSADDFPGGDERVCTKCLLKKGEKDAQ